MDNVRAALAFLSKVDPASGHFLRPMAHFGTSWLNSILPVAAALVFASASPAAELADARKLLQAGKYAEAEEAFQKLSADEPVPAALGLARCQASTGKRE